MTRVPRRAKQRAIRSESAFRAAVRAAGAAPPQSPLTFVVTFGALPGPCETTSVVRVQVAAPLLVETTLTLLAPAGKFP